MLVTRTREQARGLVDLLHERGAEAVVVPLITTVVLADPGRVAESFERATRGSPSAQRWAVFTSATAVRLCLGGLGEHRLEDMRVAAVGEATADALRNNGVTVSLVAADANAESLGVALIAAGIAGAGVWFPAAQGASAELPDMLRASGATVHRLDLYRSDMPADAPRRLENAMRQRLDAVTLTSGSTARHLVRALEGRALPEGVLVACIGESTARSAVDAGITGVEVAADASVAALVDLLAQRLGPAQPLR